MPLIILFAVVIFFVCTAVAAFFAAIIMPWAFPALVKVTFWQWFWVVALVGGITNSGRVSS